MSMTETCSQSPDNKVSKTPPATRDNSGKPQMGFVLDFPIAMEALCRVKELGAVKYERDNWKKGGKPDAEYYDAAMRHLFAAKRGELCADDSGCLHLAHAAWNILALIELNVKVSNNPDLFDSMVAKWAQRTKNA